MGSIDSNSKKQPSIVIIGAGMTGILMCIKFQKAGFSNITILEKKDNVGGTWRENTYPGVACDIPAHMYSYSFSPNPEFSNQFAIGSELQAYFEGVSKEYGVTSRVRFNEAVTEAIYKDEQWHIKTSKDESLVADFLVSATGILHHPSKPNFPGMDSFKGKIFHTAEWQHDAISKGTKVAFIGTGATACQAIPELVDMGAEVDVFQRTPQWIINVPDFVYSNKFKERLRKFPLLMKGMRKLQSFLIEQIVTKGVSGHKLQHALMTWLCKRNLNKNVHDPVLKEKLTPDYAVGCKRIINSTVFYDAIQKENAHLITDGIERFDEKGIITTDGKHHEADVVVLSTGFDPFKFMRPMNLVGKNGVAIDDAWAEKIEAYKSVSLVNFPNFFLMLGPHTPIGNYSVTIMSEIQGDYVIKLIKKWQDGILKTVEPKQAAVNSYNSLIKAGFDGTAWKGGCQSWYLDNEGNPVLWPYTWKQWEKGMQEPKLIDFV